MELGSKERVDYIYKNQLRIIQGEETFPFSKDAVLLGQFVSAKKTKGKMIDLCAGSGAISLVLSTRSQVPITGVELQPELCDMARRSAKLNGRQEQLTFICEDIRRVWERLGVETYDVITCNPPYFQGMGKKNTKSSIKAARHEMDVTIEDVVQTSSQLLKYKGKAAFVYRPERLQELFRACEQVQLTPKRIQFVHPKENRDSNIVLVETMKGGNQGLKTLPPVIVYGSHGYTDQFQRAYEGDHEKGPQLATKVATEVAEHYVYMLECGDGSYYTGYTTEPYARLHKHKEGIAAKYTRGRGPFSLIHLQAFPSKTEALREEWRIKQLTKAEKKQLIQERRGSFGKRYTLSRSDADR
ncbi:tRNA1(Val) A37 N6-methylase TrmN6/predicted GIY-YIG superfamily endonuclease [Geomicrobium halophilum]|uniref:tRNA1(Val) A37 N6-methylase TrmN6/predicted GIY-YIG superfamily endonuclease n=1 Tax=Geomicrobium halophilum TaxID=549000 RepID=A0A841PXP3_9BACL|nr:GIY-YIG nuclease family protein [Geomicrobium halophilum]MBB6451511.1 tRNA1(Val) A37 N6-methylase TrmN6/predicted GIY-YIG superfamily endonuclease [Geomicrobium halophilum]